MALITSLRFKRMHFFFLAGFVFLLWNFITFYTLTSRNHQEEDLLKERELTNRLDRLQKEMGSQMRDNKVLMKRLIELRDHRADEAKKDKEKQQPPTQSKKVPVPDPVVKEPEVKAVDEMMKAAPEVNIPGGDKSQVLPILMIACDRVTVSRALDNLLKYRPSAEKFPIIVSQDCGHAETAKVIQQYVASDSVTHIKHPDLSDIVLPKAKNKFKGYYKIARHYKWALNQVFVTFNFSSVVIVEDDLEFSPDFYEYFSSTLEVLKRDPTLWCVSAWNDNGKEGMVSNEADLLYRTDFFPGLGWMIEKKTWMELKSIWPETFWDDWMRHPETRKGRECIRPEICRTKTFGKKGVSKGLFYEKHLKFIKLNSDFVPFSKIDLSYLEKSKFDELFSKKVYSAPLMTGDDVKRGSRQEESVVRVEYKGKDSFKKLAKQLGIMDDFKAGVPRAAYRGVVSFMLKGRRIFLAPPETWTKYDESWS